MPYTLGVWKVKPGKAEEFIASWTEFAQWSAAHAAGAGSAKLLRDSSDPNRFVSIGPWDSVAAISAWRSLDGWKERIARIREMLDTFEPATLDLVSEIS